MGAPDDQELVAGHELELEGPIAYPGAKDSFYRGRCAAGDWTAKSAAPEAEIRRAFKDHVEAKAARFTGGAPEEIPLFAGKRLSKDDPLTPDDIAERLDKAALRVLRIMLDVRQAEGDLWAQVQRSRYLTNTLPWLAAELRSWGVEPQAPRESG